MVECEECGKDVTSFYELEGRKLCLGCYAELKDVDKKKTKKGVETSIPKKLEIKTRPTHVGTLLRTCSVLSTIICLLAGINMLTTQQEVYTIWLAHTHSMGIFLIGFSIFSGSLLWGIAYLIDKK